jgi:O-antigen ligase
MINNIKNYQFNQGYLIKILFSFFPLIMLMPSSYITIYVAFFIIYSYIFLFIRKIKIKIFFTDYLIIIFFFVSIFSTIASYGNSDYLILIKSIADIRFALLFLLIRNLFYHQIIKIDILLIISVVCVIFLSLDIFLQFIYGKDILGYPQIEGRYGGVFGKEAIAGGYLQKFSIFAILCLCYLKFKKIKNNKLFLFFLIIILGMAILMTLDRVPFIIYCLSLMLLLISLKGFRKIICLGALIVIIFFNIMYKTNDLVNYRYTPIYKNAEIFTSHVINLIQKNENIKTNNEKLEVITNRTGVEYYGLFKSALYVFKHNFWLGSGSKSYIKKCNELTKYKKDLLCAPHPHNVYLEILINQGIVGFIVFIIFLLTILKKYYLDLSRFKKANNNKILNTCLLIMFVVEMWPLRSYGSIFQTVNGSLFWFLISIASSKFLIKKN